ncbi:MAG: hypothetical protein AB7G93_19565 [Bdellovibrionales bacterium]
MSTSSEFLNLISIHSEFGDPEPLIAGNFYHLLAEGGHNPRVGTISSPILSQSFVRSPLIL